MRLPVKPKIHPVNSVRVRLKVILPVVQLQINVFQYIPNNQNLAHASIISRPL